MCRVGGEQQEFALGLSSSAMDGVGGGDGRLANPAFADEEGEPRHASLSHEPQAACKSSRYHFHIQSLAVILFNS